MHLIIYSHPDKNSFNHAMLEAAKAAFEKKGIAFKFRHAANSAGTVKLQEPFMNMVRPGLMLYGIYPGENLKDLARLKPVLSLKARVNFIKPIRSGESAGYGRTFAAPHATRIAIMPIGYSHGYPWNASNHASVLIHEKRFKVAGRVSMDYIAVDIGSEPVLLGDEVTLIGTDGKEQILAEDLAQWSGTISYEIVTRLASHLPRFYH